MADDFTVELTYQGTGDAARFADAISVLFGVSNAKAGEKTELMPFASENNISGVDPAALFTIIQNTDQTNFVRVRITETGGNTVDHKLLPNQFVILNGTEISVSTTEGAFAAFTTVDAIKVQADTADCIVSVITVHA